MRQSTFHKLSRIDEQFEVLNYLGMHDHCECYRVIDKDKQVYFLKFISSEQTILIDMDSLSRDLEKVSRWKSDRLMQYSTLHECKSFQSGFYFLIDFVSGESLRELLLRESTLSLHQTSQFGLDLTQCLIEIKQNTGEQADMLASPENVFIRHDELLLRAYWQPILVSHYVSNTERNYSENINLAYNNFDYSNIERRTIYSITTLLYRCLNGHFPFNYDIDWQENTAENIELIIITTRNSQPPRLSSTQASRTSVKLQSLFDKIFSHSVFPIENFHNQLVNVQTSMFDFMIHHHSEDIQLPESSSRRPKNEQSNMAGLSAVAGLPDLKALLHKDIISPLRDKDIYHEYGIQPLNGMLLYGPPGCGKTYLAQKLAEELNYFYLEIKPSDLASTYIHGTQEKIGKLFRRAKANAPSLIFIDEVDAILPDRETHAGNTHYAAEVNEFLAQMTNCSERGIFIIAATNRPEMIDKAILRTGRLDKLIYMGLPDFTARYEMFALLLRNRPTLHLDLNTLALLTEGYVSSDLVFMVNEAAKLALEKREPISNQHLDRIRSSFRPSVSLEQVASYDDFHSRQ